MKIEEVAQNTYRLEPEVPGTSLIFSVYLIKTDSSVLIEPGPSSAAPLIWEGMEQLGMKELSWIIPTHIHMDHGGGAGTLAEMFPHANVLAHPLSASHIIDPARLIQSTRLTYGEDFESIYGPITPVPESQVKVAADGEFISIGDRDLQIIYAPGHAPYHIAIFDGKTGGLFCGEALGMDTANPLPATAAPSFDMEDCLETMYKLKALAPKLLFYSHGGMRSDPERRISQVMENTRLYGNLILESLRKDESPQAISRKVIEYASAQFPPEWREDMVKIWMTGIVEGYTIYFKNKGLAMSKPIQHMKQSIREGKHWYKALLEAIGLWTVPEENFNGRHYQYLIAGEAFDWLLLAERLSLELDGLIPEEERIALLFGKPPIDVSPKQFKELIGNVKYRALLNYFYGITVEQALQLAVEMEIDKENHAGVRPHDSRDKAFQRIYGTTETALLDRFQQQKNYPKSDSITLRELDEFTYWLFKYRFDKSDSARVASDTKKALKLLEDWQVLPTGPDEP